MNDSAEAVEHRLLPIPDEARTSTAAHQFWIWAGANLAPINWVLGALGIGLGLGLTDTVIMLVVGNIIGMAVQQVPHTAIHAVDHSASVRRDMRITGP